MGSHFRLVFYTASDSVAQAAIHDVFSHLEALNEIMSDYLDGSEVVRLSALSGSGYWVRPSRELYAILDSSKTISRKTGGLFDATLGPVTQAWRKASRLKRFPPRSDVRSALQRSGYRHVALDSELRLVRLARPGMRLDFGGIGKGFAADEALAILTGLGISSAMVDAGGDLAMSAPPPGQEGWAISVSSGESRDDDEVLVLANCGVATSGATYRFFEHKGKKYSHIVNPKTGIGMTRPISATVVAASATRADALATALSVSSVRSRKKLQRNFPDARFWVKGHDELP